MSIEYRTGDLFAQPDVDALAHGVNCVGVMGGIAGEFARRFPLGAAEYAAHAESGKFTPGGYLGTDEDGPDAPTIYWLATQNMPGRDAQLDALRESLTSALVDVAQYGIETIGLPRIGCGIGGLDWETQVRTLLEEIAATTDVRLVVVTLPGESA